MQVKDAKRLAATHEKLVALIKAEFAADEKRAEERAKAAAKDQPMRSYYRRRPAPRIVQFQFAGKDVFFFDSGEEVPFAPAWCLTDKELIVALFPQNVKAYLSRDAKYRSLATSPEVAAALKAGDGPLVLGYCDTPKLFELVYPFVPMIGQVILSELRREGIDMNVAMIPSAKAIAPHLTPGVMSVRRTKAGIEMSSRQTLPGGGAMLPLMTLPMWVFTARSVPMHSEAMRAIESGPAETSPFIEKVEKKTDSPEKVTKPRKTEKAPERPDVPAPPRPR